MSRHCPSCGSNVQDQAALCQTCGERLLDGRSDALPTQQTETTAERRPTPAPTSKEQTDRSETIICADCGAENKPGRSECIICGSPVATAAPTSPPLPSAMARRPIPSSAARDYLLTTVVAVVIGGIALLASTPEEKTGPPMPPSQAGGANGAMPHGHPPTNAPQLTPQQQQQIAEAEKQAAANPADLAAKLKLANLYYDVDRHAEAIPLYQDYVRAHPENLSARTDMAFSIASTAGLDSGITKLHEVLKIDPTFQNAVYNLAMMYIAKRDRDSTLYWLQRTVQLDPNSRPGQFASEILHGVQTGALGDSTGAAAR